ncbi:hypothetical protein M406DRAFT_324829, partial [Cryphonectria parasitica EP155]
RHATPCNALKTCTHEQRAIRRLEKILRQRYSDFLVYFGLGGRILPSQAPR